MIKLYPYQETGKREIYKFFEKPAHRKLLYVMPTGTGKTTVFSSLTLDQFQDKQYVLLVVHRVELVEQIAKRLRELGIFPGIIADGYPIEKRQVQVASIQTLINRTPPPADWVIIDECHHSKADSYKILWGIYPKAKIIGFTATPIRLDGQGFDDQFQLLMNLYPMRYFFDNNFLVKPEHLVCSYQDEPVRVINGEYDQEALSNLMCNEKYVHDPLEAYLKHAKGKKFVVFCVNREHSIRMSQEFNEAGIPSAHIDGTTHKDLRKKINDDFASGKLLGLMNYDIISEGYDVPDIEVAILARRTKSLANYLQWIGRALRPSPGKLKALILDCAGLWLEHKAIAGDDFQWSLQAGETKKIKSNIEPIYTNDKLAEPANDLLSSLQDFEEPIIGTNSRGDIFNMSTAEEIPLNVSLLPVTSDIRRVMVFEAFLHEAQKKKHKLLSAAFQYEKYLITQNTPLSNQEIEYCKRRMNELRVPVRDGFWYHLSKNIQDSVIEFP